MTDATHGICQICGATQKLIKSRRGRVLANHGYTVRGCMGQAGTCPGSRHEPIDASASAIESEIAYATLRRDRAAADLAEMTAAGYVWDAGVVPRLAINSRREAVANQTAYLTYLAERLALASREGR